MWFTSEDLLEMAICLTDQSIITSKQALVERNEAITESVHAKARIIELERELKESKADNAKWFSEWVLNSPTLSCV
ncbi:hypothetical protein GUJ93_ZPchr0012g20634 [Zizania palustris]|uniref:Uncharacterized protein n=1 Tax=Zizania palustris TaxID=103762 RepID=A0A8J5WQC3_ZIZPA|nr:hypothetical protein GUJ93_ZPchr0012g20634 [Zizania palustris]